VPHILCREINVQNEQLNSAVVDKPRDARGFCTTAQPIVVSRRLVLDTAYLCVSCFFTCT